MGRAMAWNYKISGNIFKRKRELEGTIGKIQKQQERRYKDDTIKILQGLQSDYKQVLSQEEAYWKQQARCEWIDLGDRKTQFFYTTTMISYLNETKNSLFERGQ